MVKKFKGCIKHGASIPNLSVIEGTATVESCVTLGWGVEVQETVRFGMRLTTGFDCEFRGYNRVGEGSFIADGAVFGEYCWVYDRSVLGDRIKAGHHFIVGNKVTIGKSPFLSEGFKFGLQLTMEGLKIIAFTQLSCVDGTGRTINVYIHRVSKNKVGIKIRAGCFFGTLSRFVDQAKAEDKPYYVVVVSAAARALKNYVVKHGITNGW